LCDDEFRADRLVATDVAFRGDICPTCGSEQFVDVGLSASRVVKEEIQHVRSLSVGHGGFNLLDRGLHGINGSRGAITVARQPADSVNLVHNIRQARCFLKVIHRQARRPQGANGFDVCGICRENQIRVDIGDDFDVDGAVFVFHVRPVATVTEVIGVLSLWQRVHLILCADFPHGLGVTWL
jgi:hypothetical protein